MSEEKPFDPTPSRLERARREGDVARSHELSAAVSFAAGAVALAALLPALAGAARLELESASRGAAGAVPYALQGLAVAAVLAAAACGAALAALAQGGFGLRPLGFSLSKLAPAEGLKRMFSREAALSAVKAVLAACACGLAALPALRGAFGAGIAAPQLADLVRHSAASIAASVVAIGLLFGFLDALVERARRRRRLRMSFDELRRDRKEHDGDPNVRGRRREAHRSLIRGSLGRVAEASFVVTNPAHVAVALAYRPPAISVPRVLVRAVDAGAQTVKRLARERGIPVVENVALAHLLLARCDVDAAIPSEAYLAVAEIVASLALAGRNVS